MTGDWVVLATVVAGTGLGALIDLRTRRVPNVVTFALAAAGCGLAVVGWSGVTIEASLLGLAFGLGLMLPAHVFGATGAGDVKLLAAVGAVIGVDRVLHAFLYALVAGGVLAIVVALTRRNLRQTLAGTARLVATGGATAADIEHPARHNRFAYEPAIAVGAVLAALGV
jgi:prepilin peptidase CpaA